MPSDKKVTAQMVLNATLELKRRGSNEILRQLEATEPDLTEYFLESLSVINQHMLTLWGRSKPTLRVLQEVQGLAMTCILALQNGHAELWQNLMEDPQVARSEVPKAKDSDDPQHPAPNAG